MTTNEYQIKLALLYAFPSSAGLLHSHVSTAEEGLLAKQPERLEYMSIRKGYTSSLTCEA